LCFDFLLGMESGSVKEVTSLAGPRMPADHGLSGLGLLMQIVGTVSMGVMALVGLLSIFDDSAGREEVDLRHKQLDDRFFSALEFGVSSGGLRYREGAVAGQKIKLFFNSLVRADLGERNIEELALPLTLVATDIGTGGRVAMRSGSLTTAMRASMSVPGVMAPIVRENRKLVDGGLVDNVPIQEVRERCGAEAVIAINVGSPLMQPEEVGGLLSVVGQMVNLLTEQNVARSLALLGPQDILISPDLSDVSFVDFDRGKDLVARG
jgi:NTE family protein